MAGLDHAGGDLAEERDEPAGRLDREEDEAQQRRLAGAGRPGEELERARLDGKREVAQDLRPHAVAHAHVLELNGGGSLVEVVFRKRLHSFLTQPRDT
jgi:hypothetical protein